MRVAALEIDIALETEHPLPCAVITKLAVTGIVATAFCFTHLQVLYNFLAACRYTEDKNGVLGKPLN